MPKTKFLRRPRQPALPGLEARSDTRHGHDIRPGKRKTARPIDPRRPMHVTMRALRAREEQSFLSPRRARLILDLVLKYGRTYDVRVERYVNVGNHLHLLVRPRTRAGMQRFLRVVAGRIAVVSTGAVKGRPAGQGAAHPSSGRAFWDGLAFSRAVSWGRDLRGTHAYLDKNAVESLSACFAGWGTYIEGSAWKAEPPPKAA